MKILRIIYDWPPPWGGLAPHAYELTKAQVGLGHTFEVFCGRWPSAGAVEQIPNVHVTAFIREPLPGTISFTTSVLMFIYYLLWQRNNTVDVIHSHGHFGIWVYLYRKLLKRFFTNAKELKTPLVVHFHNTVEGRWQAALHKKAPIKFYSKYFSWPLARLADKWAVETADAYVFVSEGVKSDAIKYYGADPSKSFVVESGVNMDLFSPIDVEEREKTRKELGFDLYDKVILNHGLMVARKNIHLLVASLVYLPRSYKLLLVGPGDLAYQEKISDLIRNYKITDRVVRVGYTPYSETAIAFQASDIFVLPSNWEGVPKVVLQGLSCGVPALVSGFKLAEDISGLYYLTDTKPESIASEIRKIVENPHAVPMGLGKLRRLYSWEEKAHEMEKVYDFIRKEA